MKSNRLFNASYYNGVYNYIVALLFVVILVSLVGCSSGTALRHYKKVAAETQLPLTPEKKNALATVCGREFPIEQKTITKDSIVTKYVKVVDNTLVNKLRKQIEEIKKQTPNIKLDSLYQSFYDSVLNDLPECKQVEHYKTTENKGKDTIGNYYRALEKKQLQDTLDDRNAKIVLATQTIEEKEIKEQKLIHEINVWRKRFFILLGIVLLYAGLRFLASKYTLPFKIK